MYNIYIHISSSSQINIGIKLEMMEILSNQNVKDINRNDI